MKKMVVINSGPHAGKVGVLVCSLVFMGGGFITNHLGHPTPFPRGGRLVHVKIADNHDLWLRIAQDNLEILGE